jgi:hypothetical protein
MKDYYKILGVDSDADPEVIKSAYRTLARIYHPDVNKDPKSEAIIKLVTESYDVIGNPESRREYDKKYWAAMSKASKQYDNSNRGTTKPIKTKTVYGVKLSEIILHISRLISPFIFLAMVFGLISFFSWICSPLKNNNEVSDVQPQTRQIPIPSLSEIDKDLYTDWDAVLLTTGKTPECYNFKAKFDKSIDNKLHISVGKNSDVVIKLLNTATNSCIRYVYIRAGDDYSILNIPKGIYYTKIAYGKDWKQKIVNGKCIGKFTKDPIYKIGEQRLDFNFIYTDDGYQIPSFKLTLDVTYIEKDNRRYSTDNISEEQFNE